MTGMNEGIMRPILTGIVCAFVLTGIGAGTPMAAEPALLLYPNKPTTFRYDPARYELITPADPAFNTGFSISGVMLWDKIEARIPHEVYRAPELVGFEPSPYGRNEFVVRGPEFNVIVDGYSDVPRTFYNLHMRFVADPSHSLLSINLAGEDRDGLIVPLPDLDVSTPTADGHYADTDTHHLRWSGAIGLRITVYSDKNNDGVYNGDGPHFSIYVTDGVVSTEETSWGTLKALYGGQ